MNKILLCDVMDGLSDILDETADIVLADPPYNIGKDFGSSKDNRSLKDYLYWTREWLDLCLEILKESGTLYIYGFPEILCHVAADLPYPMNKQHRWLVWHYTNKAIPRYEFWQRSHESILCCWKSDARIFNTDDVRIPYTSTFLKNAAGKMRKNTPGRYSHKKNGEDKADTEYKAHERGALPRDLITTETFKDKLKSIIDGLKDEEAEKVFNILADGGLPQDVIKVAALAGGAGRAERYFLCKACDKVYHNKELGDHEGHTIKSEKGEVSAVIHHPTQKPYELTKRLLLAAKPKENGHVVIPFVGSGSECAVCEDLGMTYIGFDNNPDYIKLANGFLKKRKSSLAKD